jgi:tetratricopeptide (TPR) repeat protein
MKLRLTIVLVLALSVTVLATVLFQKGGGQRPVAVTIGDQASDGALRREIGRLQVRLRDQPDDARSWSGLGVAYVEQARQSGDPTFYPKAEKALSRSLRLAPDNADALAGQAALAAARHDFTGALALTERALKINPYDARALAVRVDALVELGRYDAAWTAVRAADARRPGIPIFTRYAYVLELRGDAAGARKVLGRALDSATDPYDISFVRYQLGDLSLNTGHPREALADFELALAADPQNLAALDGRARARQANGDAAGALADRESLVARAPLPGYVTALGELYDKNAQPGKATAQYSIVTAWSTLARANGVNPDLELSLFEADHGSPGLALRYARAEYARRPGSVHASDALAWALHATGDDRQALRYARAAARTGYRNAQFEAHLRVIEGAAK